MQCPARRNEREVMSAARFDVILMNRVATVQYNVQRGRMEREVMSTGRFDVILMNRVATVQCNVQRGGRERGLCPLPGLMSY